MNKTKRVAWHKHLAKAKKKREKLRLERTSLRTSQGSLRASPAGSSPHSTAVRR
jgi:hypothetical protein